MDKGISPKKGEACAIFVHRECSALTERRCEVAEVVEVTDVINRCWRATRLRSSYASTQRYSNTYAGAAMTSAMRTQEEAAGLRAVYVLESPNRAAEWLCPPEGPDVVPS